MVAAGSFLLTALLGTSLASASAPGEFGRREYE